MAFSDSLPQRERSDADGRVRPAMPTIDVKTLLMVTTTLALLLGGMFLAGWSRERSRHLAAWGVANLLIAPAAVLLALRGVVPDWVSIWGANSALALAYGLFLQGAVAFEGGRPRLAVTVAGATLWSVLCLWPPFLDDFAMRVVTLSGIGTVYGGLTAMVLWQGRHGLMLPSRSAAVATLAGGAAIHAGRSLATPLFPIPADFAAINGSWLAMIGMVGLLTGVAAGHFLYVLSNERAAARHRRIAEVDHLTGVATRRVFEERVARLLLAAPDRGSLVFFDIDRFKTINDTHGHAVGDRALISFAAVAREAIGGGDVLARWGGEEFVLFLADRDFVAAHRVAENIRAGFAGRAVDGRGGLLGATVSAGIAAPALVGADLDRLVACADAAVYAAKRAGRDRVEVVTERAARNAA